MSINEYDKKVINKNTEHSPTYCLIWDEEDLNSKSFYTRGESGFIAPCHEILDMLYVKNLNRKCFLLSDYFPISSIKALFLMIPNEFLGFDLKK